MPPVPLNELLSEKECEQAHAAEEDAEGHLMTAQGYHCRGPGISAGGCCRLMKDALTALRALDPDDEDSPEPERGAGKRGCHHGQDGEPQAKECAHHGHELYIAEPHSLDAAPAEIGGPDSVEERRADERAEGRVHQGEEAPGNAGTDGKVNGSGQEQGQQVIDGNEKGNQQAETESRESHLVGQQVRFGVGEDQPKQKKAENHAFQRGEREPEMPIAGQEQKAGEEFDHHVTGSDFFFAVATTPAQDQPTEDGDIVIKVDGLLAMGARRSWPDHGEAAGQAVNAHVQEAAEKQSEDEESGCDERIQSGSHPPRECELVRPDYKL